MSKSSEKTVLVTGCSTGIGYSTALHLAESGFHVLAGVRTESDCERLEKIHRGITPVILDVTDMNAIEAVTNLIEDNYGHRFYGVVNNAGVMYPGPLEVIEMDQMRREMDVNYFGAVALTKQLLPLIKRVRGRIVNMSSMNGRMAMPAVGSYSATKFALEGFTDALRMEIAHTGVNVSLIEPGQIKTSIFNKALEVHNSINSSLEDEHQEDYGPLMKAIEMGMEMGNNSSTDPLQVAQSVHIALSEEKPKHRYVVGDDALGFAQMVENCTSEEVDTQILTAFGLLN